MLGISLAMLIGSALLMLRLSPGGRSRVRFRRKRRKNILRSGKMEISPPATSLLSTISALLLTSLKNIIRRQTISKTLYPSELSGL